MSRYKDPVPVWEKFLLIVREASSYFNIGENKLAQFIRSDKDNVLGLTVQNGKRVMINKKKFENYLNTHSSI